MEITKSSVVLDGVTAWTYETPVKCVGDEQLAEYEALPRSASLYAKSATLNLVDREGHQFVLVLGGNGRSVRFTVVEK